MLKPIDPLILRLCSGTLFAGAFIWVAIRYFEVDAEVVWVLFVFSVMFVVGLIVLGFVFSFAIRFLRRGSGGMLDNLESEEKATGADE